MRRYVNAQACLPPELFAEVQKYCSGLIWVTPANPRRGQKRKFIEKLLLEGHSPQSLRSRFNASASYVRPIAAELNSRSPEANP